MFDVNHGVNGYGVPRRIRANIASFYIRRTYVSIIRIFILFILILIGSLIASAASMAEGDIRKEYDDRPFICGALYRILMEGHINDKDKRIYFEYKNRFDRLYQEAKVNLRKLRGDKADAQQEMQDNIDFMGEIGLRKDSTKEKLFLFCEKSERLR